MKKMLKMLGIAAVLATILGFVACSDSGDGGSNPAPAPKPNSLQQKINTAISAGDSSLDLSGVSFTASDATINSAFALSNVKLGGKTLTIDVGEDVEVSLSNITGGNIVIVGGKITLDEGCTASTSVSGKATLTGTIPNLSVVDGANLTLKDALIAALDVNGEASIATDTTSTVANVNVNASGAKLAVNATNMNIGSDVTSVALDGGKITNLTDNSTSETPAITITGNIEFDANGSIASTSGLATADGITAPTLPQGSTVTTYTKSVQLVIGSSAAENISIFATEPDFTGVQAKTILTPSTGGTAKETTTDLTSENCKYELGLDGQKIVVHIEYGSILAKTEDDEEWTMNVIDVDRVSPNKLFPAYEDAVFVIKFDSAPTINRDSGKVVTIYNSDETVLATIKPKDETINIKTKNGVQNIKAGKDMIVVDGNNLIIKVPTASNSTSSVLQNGKGYCVAIDDGLITGTVAGKAFHGVLPYFWIFSTRVAPSVTAGTIKVSASGKMADDSDADFSSLQGAFNHMMANASTTDWTITVASGRYHENLSYSGTANAKIVGEGGVTAITDSRPYFFWNNSQLAGNSQRTRQTFMWNGKNLTIKNMSFENTASRLVDCGGQSKDIQAETLYFDCNSDLVVVDSKFVSYQDTLLIGTSDGTPAYGGRAWFYNCEVAGDVDFIWGYATVCLLENCKITCRNDNIKKSSEIFASRTPADIEKVGKGFILWNSDIVVEDGCDAYYGRSSGGGDSQATVLDCTVTGTINKKLWNSKGSVLAYDVAKDSAIAFKSYNNKKKSDNSLISTTDKLEGTEDLSARVAGREYNGRWVMVNRVFNKTTKAYENVAAANVWDINAIAVTTYNAPADNSEKNIFVDPVFKKNVVSTTDTVQLTVTPATAAGLTYTYASSNESIATVDNAGLVTPVANADGEVTITVTASNGAADTAKIIVIPTKIPAQSISLGSYDAGKTLVLDTTDFLTAIFTPEDASIQDVTWSTSDESIIKLVENPACGTNGESSETQIAAVGVGTATITATSVDDANVKKEVTVTVTDEGKTIGVVPAGGYTFNFIAVDKASKDGFLSGVKTTNTVISYNVGSTGTGAKGSGKDNVLSGKYITLLKGFGQATLRVANDLNNIQMKNTSGHRPENDGSQWKTSACVGPTGIDALMLKGVKGPVKIIPTLGKVGGDRTFAAMICPTGATTAAEGTFAKWAAPTSGTYTVMEGFGYDGDGVVDIYFGGSNDIDIISIKLEPYTPPVADVSIAFTDSSMATLDLNGTKTAKREATLGGADKNRATVTYESDKPGVATVSSDGTVTAVGMGIATITAKESLKKQTATYQVLVKDTETVGDSYTLNFTLYASSAAKGSFDFGKFSVVNGKYNGPQHGWQFGSDGTLNIPVTGSCDVTDGTGTYSFSYSGAATTLKIGFDKGAYVHKIQVLSSNAGTAYAQAKKYDFTEIANYNTYVGYTTALNGFAISGGGHNSGTADNDYGWDMKKDSTVTLVVSGGCTVTLQVLCIQLCI